MRRILSHSSFNAIRCRYYNKGEIKDFEGNECEWPIFYTFMIIDGVFKMNNEQIEEYQAELRKCMYSDENGGLIFYFLIEKTKLLKNKSFTDPVITMYFTPDGNGGYQRSPSKSLFLWGQSVFIIAQLLTAGLLHINELDMIRRYLPSYNRPRKGGRYSAFQVRIFISDFHNRDSVSLYTYIFLAAG